MKSHSREVLAPSRHARASVLRASTEEGEAMTQDAAKRAKGIAAAARHETLMDWWMSCDVDWLGGDFDKLPPMVELMIDAAVAEVLLSDRLSRHDETVAAIETAVAEAAKGRDAYWAEVCQRAKLIACQRVAGLEAALKNLVGELSDLQIEAVREVCGNTNAACLHLRVHEAKKALGVALTQAPARA